MMSYPLEAEKGRFISWFWMIFNMGGVIGSLVSGEQVDRYNSKLTCSRFHWDRISTTTTMEQYPTAPTLAFWC